MRIVLPTLAEDKGNHWAYGTLICAFTAAFIVLGWWIVALCVGFEVRAWRLAAVAGAGAIAVTAVFGKLKEVNDQRLNDAALLRGERPRHGVEFADFRATVWGGLVVGVPILIGALVLWLAGV